MRSVVRLYLGPPFKGLRSRRECGELAQLGERRFCTPKATGSIPVFSRCKLIYITKIYKCLFFDFPVNVAVLDLSGLMKFIKLIDQGNKGVWWMPWYREAMKGVANCDKPRGAVSRL